MKWLKSFAPLLPLCLSLTLSVPRMTAAVCGFQRPPAVPVPVSTRFQTAVRNPWISPPGGVRTSSSTELRLSASSPKTYPRDSDGNFVVTVDLPPSGSDLTATMKMESILPAGAAAATTGDSVDDDGDDSTTSVMVEVRYEIPFDLNVEPKGGLAVCTKDGTNGERVGDVLRYTSQWTMGLPRGDGLVTTAASFAGGLSWQCSMFDVLKAKQWEQVVEALTSNVPGRTDEVVLLFERAVSDKKEE